MKELTTEVLIAGGGLGGCAAALACAQAGSRVILTEETDWIGGQLTSQAVPPDENRWIETFGGTRSYREFRSRVRDYYRRNYPLTAEARMRWNLNPGNGLVSRLCHEPKVALAVLYEMLAPYVNSGRVQLLLNHKPVRADVEGDYVRSVAFLDTRTGREKVIHASFVLDATELGDLLPLTGTEYVTGAESQAETGEMHAVEGPPEPLNMQAITYCFALDYFPDEEHVIDKPEQYDFWRSYVPDLDPPWPGPLLSWIHSHPRTLKPRRRVLFDHEFSEQIPKDGGSLWDFRQIIDAGNFVPGTYESSITIVNWPQCDYFLGPIIEVEPDEAEKHLEAAKQLSLSLLYWLQTEAPRPDGGVGYPGLRLRADVVGTEDGLAKYPYIRESRRIRAVFTVTEEHVGRDQRQSEKAEYFHDSVGIGHYNIDLHPSTGGDNYIDIRACPFQIPLGSLLPVRMRNLLPACKNIGTTHITNGCYRLHPVEWNIGEAAGALAAFCLEHRTEPQAVRTDRYLSDYQRMLIYRGIELAWPNIGP